MKVKFKKLHDDAVLPAYAKPGDAGMDLTATENGKWVESKEGEAKYYYVEYGTGLAMEIPDGHVGLLFPRSSISKTALLLANHVGIIDSKFRQEVKLRFKLDGGLAIEMFKKEHLAAYKKGDRVGQLMIIPFPTIEPEWAEELSSEDRGGGFGSTGS